MFLGIEIGGTKLQLGLGRGDGTIHSLWRGSVNPEEGGEGIRRQIVTAFPELLGYAMVDSSEILGIGVGFGGPTDDESQTVIKSHQIAGWDNFPLADWLTDLLEKPTVICNDADVAGLGEAMFGAGRGLSPIFYITVGTGVGGGLIIDGKIFRGCGRGAAEIGHLRPIYPPFSSRNRILEDFTSGNGIRKLFEIREETHQDTQGIRELAESGIIGGKEIAAAASAGDPAARAILRDAVEALAEGICSVIALLCPRRIVIGGGVSLMGEDLFFAPLRQLVAERVFQPFAGLTDIVPAALGEEVVIHGALALARQKFAR